MPRYRFGPFEYDSDRSRLLRQGVRLRLQRKPLIVLTALLEEPGKTISRRQLHQLLWPDSTAVDFDQGLNVAVRKLRDVLGDSRDRPSYIETVAGSGYRFIEAVELFPGNESAGALPYADSPPATTPSAPRSIEERIGPSRIRWKLKRVRVLAISSGALLAILSISFVLAFPTLERRLSVHPLKASIVFPSELRLMTSGERGGLAFSPDGSGIVFSAAGPDGRTRLWLRNLDSLTPKEIPGTEGGSFPFWSPDGKSMGFFTESELKTISLADHSARTLCQVNSARGGTWSPAGVILFARDTRSPIYRISADGGTPIPVTTLEEGKDTTHRWPMFLSDGKRFVFLEASHQSAGAPGRLFLASLDGGGPNYLGESDSDAIPLSDSILFVLRGKLLSQKLNLQAANLESRASIIAEGVDYDPGLWHGAFAASARSIVYRPRNVSTESQTLAWFDMRGNKIGEASNPGVFRGVSLAPDGKTVATLCGDPDTNVCLIHVDGTVTQINRGGISSALAWAPDSSAVAYAKHLGQDRFEVAVKPIDSALSERTISNGAQDSWPLAWLPKNTDLLLARTTVGNRCEVVVMNISTGTIRQFLPASDGLIHSASFSPDGKWVAYDKAVDDRNQIYIASFPNPSASYRMTTEDGSSPKWRSDGQVYFLGSDETLYSVAVTQANGTLKFGDPRSLFHPPILSAPWDRNSFDVSGGGMSVLVNSSSNSKPSELVLLMER